MNFIQLEYYVAAVESGSYATAARELFVNPSTISLAISNLEEELGKRLLTRSNTGVVPTSEGKLFYERACHTVLSFTALQEFSAGPPLSISGSSLRIGMDSSCAPSTLFPKEAFDTFRSRFPQIHVKVLDAPASICASFLKKGLLDAAIVIGAKSEHECPSCRIANKAARVLVGDRNPVSVLDRVGVQSILNMPVALPNDVGYLFQHINTLFLKHSASPRFEILGTDKEEILHFFSSLNGVAFVLEETNIQAEYQELMQKSIIDEDRFTVPINFVKSPESEPKNVNALLSHLRSFEVSRKTGNPL